MVFDFKIENICKLFLVNFFLIVLIARLCYLIGFDFNLFRLFQMMGLLGGLYFLKRIRFNTIDKLLIIYLLYIMLNSFTIDYPNHNLFCYYAFFAQIIPILFYFIGRGTCYSTQEIFSKMKWPLLFTMIVGLYCFVLPPGWYLQMKYEQVSDTSSEYSISGIFRLSAFWGHPYQIGYAMIMYLCWLYYSVVGKLHKENKYKYFDFFQIFLCIICLLLAQLRVTIYFSIVAFLYVVHMLLGKKGGQMLKFLIPSFIVITIALYIISIMGSDVSDYISTHMLSLFNQQEYADRFEHTAGNVVDYSLFGNGFGRYGFEARNHNGWAIVDHEFQRETAELGYIGIVMLLAILVVTFFYGFQKKNCIIEYLIFLFFFFAMIGASVLSNEHQYNYIFWFCVGRIWNPGYRNNQF